MVSYSNDSLHICGGRCHCCNHVCFLKRTDSMFGDPTKRSRTIHARKVFFYDIESRLEEKYECRFQSMNVRGECITL